MNGVARVVSFFIMSFVVPLADAAEPPAWVKQSDENAQIALAVYARYWPNQRDGQASRGSMKTYWT